MIPDEHGEFPPDAVAIVGAGCRLPGGIAGLDAFWEALRAGRDSVGTVPRDRFDTARFVDPAGRRPGRSYTGAGGFLDDIGHFDAAYFGIAPAEAAVMDPQQRLLLELTAEALDDAGIPADSLAGSDTCVFVGVGDQSYGQLQLTSADVSSPHVMTGALPSVVANRVSYVFDLHGPSMSVDTACSSSLVALDRACRTLLDGTSRVALAAGVNVLLSPFGFVGFSQAAMLSPRGRCAAFSAEADGFVRAEGGGVVVLKRLADALADGDRVHAVVAGTGTNSDGRTRGLPLPSVTAQEDLLRAVCGRAGVTPDDLVYFEAHGTGTRAGDPAEAAAIGRALARRRTRGPLPIGSVKSNLGHLETASGMAGLLKAVLVLRHGTAPPTLHAVPLNPDIDFTGLNLAPTVEPCPLPRHDRAAVGVNSFGFGGSNAHAVLTVPPPPAPRPDAAGGAVLPVVVSARSAEALAALAARVSARLATAAPAEFYDLAHTTTRRRTAHPHRAAVLAANPREAADRLDALLDGRPTAGALGRRAGRVAFVFSGNGSQWPGMAADLLAEKPDFRAAVEEVDAALAPHLGWSVAEELRHPAEDRWRRTEVVQPALFAVQAGLVALLAARGVRPALVLGHSVGEVAAAHAAGALDLAAAARVIAARGTAQAATAGTGRMAAVGLSADAARAELDGYGGALEISAVNSDRDVTVAGDPDALAALGDALRRRDVFFRELAIDHAFHSRAMDPVREPLATALAGLTPGAARIPMISTVTGAPVTGGELTADYWWRNVREPVRFADAVAHTVGEGADVLLEIGPHPVLRGYLRRATPSTPVTCLPTLRRDGEGPRDVAAALAGLLAADVPVDWDAWFPHPARVADLPAYPWQRERHWRGDAYGWQLHTSGVGPADHPLLGHRLPGPRPAWEGTLEPQLVPWLGDHRVTGTVLMPAAAYLEMALTAGRLALDTAPEIRHLELARPLPLGASPGPAGTGGWPDPGGLRLTTAFDPEAGTFLVGGAERPGAAPGPLVRGQVRALLDPRPAPLDPDALRARCPGELDGPGFYALCEGIGLQLGPAFRTVTAVRTGEGEYLATYTAGDFTTGHETHAVLLDTGLQLCALLLTDPDRATGDGHHLPSAFDTVRVWDAVPRTGLVHVRERGRNATEVWADLTWATADGTVHAVVEGCRLRRLADIGRMPLTVQHTVLRAAPHPGAPAGRAPLPAPDELAEAAGERVAALRADWRRAAPDRYAADLALTGAHGWAAALAGLVADPATPFDMPALVARGLQPRHRRLVRLMLPALTRHGLVEPAGPDRWRLTGTAPDPDDLLRRLVHDHPAHLAETHLLIQQTRHLPALLRGEADPTETADEREAAHEQLYDTAPAHHFAHRVAATLLRRAVADWPADRPLRVLDLGTGHGGLTTALLPLLPPERTRYTCAALTPAALTRAEHRFAAYDFVEYRTLDPDAELTGQGYPAANWDVVVAGDVLHTADDLAATLRRVAALLVPGGLLLAVESHDDERHALLTGTADRLWRRGDHDLRPVTALLAADRWLPLLADSGFRRPVRIGGPEVSVLLAAAPDDAPAPAEPGPPDAEPGTRWLVAAETEAEATLCAALGDLLATATPGGSVTTVLAPAEPDGWHLGTGDGPVAVVLVLADADADADTGTGGDALARATHRTALLRDLAAACERLPDAVRPAVWLVTRPSGVLPAPERPAHPADAVAWGAARSLANEHPRLRVRRLSLDRAPGDPAGDARRLARELLAPGEPGEEDEIALTGGGRFVPRHVAAPADRPTLPGPAAGPAAESFVLEAADPGLRYRLAWRAVPRPRPGPGEVVVAVRAVGLNYRDAMRVNGLLPLGAATERGQGLGMECAGVVTEVGPGVTERAVGDRVVSLGDGALVSHLVLPAHRAVPLPDGMPFAEAATLPVVFATVHHVLTRQARLAAGETVLVHGAAGGVGLAALQCARACGAEVVATAGSPAKRDLLHALGVRHVLDSRSLAFVPGVLEATEGRGVDVVVNSLSGDAIRRGLELLRPGGRFLEIGKRDILADSPLPLGAFRNGIAFFSYDLGEHLRLPGGDRAFGTGLMPLLRDGTYRPLPYTAYPAARVAEAFRTLQHSRHTGKIVLTLDPLDGPVPTEPALTPPPLDPGGTYLVTGGLGGFGAATAEWLAGRGARHLALVGRRGGGTPGADALLARLAGRGVQATPYAADAADPAAMARVLDAIDRTGHPLRGVVHAAAHFDDAPLAGLSGERIAAVLAPKLAGAAVLDRLTRGRDLHLFLLFSSVSAVVGNLDQAPYAAANAYLEALVRARRHAGLPGLALAFGPVGDTGYVARNDLAETMAALGFDPLTPAEALRTAGSLAGTAADVAGPGRPHWSRLGQVLPALRAPRWSPLVPARAADDHGGTRADLLRSLSGLSEEETHAALLRLVAGSLGTVLALDPSAIDPHRRLDELGVDSLMGAQFLLRLRDELDIHLTPLDLGADASLAHLATLAQRRLTAVA